MTSSSITLKVSSSSIPLCSSNLASSNPPGVPIPDIHDLLWKATPASLSLKGNEENTSPAENQQDKKRPVETLDTDLTSETPLTPKKRYVKTDQKLGEGTFGLVLKARDCLTNSPVAFKVHKPHFSDYRGALQESKILSVHREHQTLHSLFFRHSYDSTPKKGKNDKLIPIHTIVTDFLPARDIYKSHLAHNAPLGPLAWDEIKTICRQVLEFINHSEHNKIAHLDLKPLNLIYLKDLRQTFVLDCGSSEMEEVTGRAYLCQTSFYRCPEEMLSFESENMPPRTGQMDVWSMGCILFELLTRKPLFEIFDHKKNLEISFKNHLQMIGEQVGFPSVDFLKSWEKASQFYEVSSLHQVTIKKPKRLKIKPWKEQVLQAAREEGVPDDEIELFCDLLEKMISYIRPSAGELLKHPYFKNDISFHLQGVFSPKDTVRIYRKCELEDGKPMDSPAIFIENPYKIRHNCMHIPRDLNNEYFIRVERNGKPILTQYFTFEDDSDVTLPLPEESDTSISSPRLGVKRVLFAEEEIEEVQEEVPPPFSPSSFFN